MNSLTIKRAAAKTAWDEIPLLCKLSYPWDKEDHFPETHFKAFHTGEELCFQFKAFCGKPLIYRKEDDKLEVRFSERVELFFREEASMETYYCLEMDPQLRVLDYKARYYRQFDRSWQWPSNLQLTCCYLENAYTLRGALSLKTLSDLKLLKGNRLEAGVYRGHVHTLKGEDADIRWSTWLKPDCSEPDFHLASSFGQWLLEDYPKK